MIDFIKIRITDEALINLVWNNPLLEYDSKSEKRFNDEIKELQKRKYINLYFTKYYNRIEIKGSLHYFFNNNMHNANDFKVDDCINLIFEIKNLFNLDLLKCNVINLEYGVNIISPIPINDLILNLIYHEKRPFIRATEHSYYRIAGKESYKQIKAYNKGVQFPYFCNENTFRFEVKSRQSKFINKKGIFNLNDLTIKSNYTVLVDSLIEEWGKVLLFDKSKLIDNKFFNTFFWEEIIFKSHRNKFNIQKKIYYKNLGLINLHTTLKKIMISKTIELL